jgi:hypothetical protein
MIAMRRRARVHGIMKTEATVIAIGRRIGQNPHMIRNFERQMK